MKRCLTLVFLLLLFVAALPSAAQVPESMPGPAHPVAFDVTDCQLCHADLFTKFEQTDHAELPNSCASCHGDVAAHAAAMLEGADPVEPIRFASLRPGEASAICLNCHERREQMHFRGNPHDRRDVSCIRCHSVHNFMSTQNQLRTQREQDLCYGCHPAVRAKMMRTSHHPVREGLMECSSCHNPHGATKKLIKADYVNDLCFQCHTEKRGPFLWEHAPVREDCTLCHSPHGSNHQAMLVGKMPQLCQRCHLNTRHPGTLYDRRNFIGGTSPSNRAFGRSCMNCHPNVHGSNAPSGPYLGR